MRAAAALVFFALTVAAAATWGYSVAMGYELRRRAAFLAAMAEVARTADPGAMRPVLDAWRATMDPPHPNRLARWLEARGASRA